MASIMIFFSALFSKIKSCFESPKGPTHNGDDLNIKKSKNVKIKKTDKLFNSSCCNKNVMEERHRETEES